MGIKNFFLSSAGTINDHYTTADHYGRRKSWVVKIYYDKMNLEHVGRLAQGQYVVLDIIIK